MTHRRSGPTLNAAVRLRHRVLSLRRRSLSFSISLSLLNRVWSSQHYADHNLAFASIVIAAPHRSQSQYRTVWSRLSSNLVASLSSFFSQFDQIWWYFFLGFVCVSVLRNEWYYIFVWQLRKCEKMWATSRKCIFYGIFKNTTKHQKIFSFPENSIFGKYFTWTKHSLNTYIRIKRKCRLKKKKKAIKDLKCIYNFVGIFPYSFRFI